MKIEMNLKKILYIIFIAGFVISYDNCDNSNDSSGEFVVDIASDDDSSDSESKSIKNISKRVYFDNMVLDFPKAEYAGFYVSWLTTPKALEFNATEGMKEEEYRNFFEKYNNHIRYALINNKKLRTYMYFLKDKNSGRLIGDFMIDDIDYHNLKGTLRFVVATDLENKGYGTKIMRIMLEKAFDEIGLYRVEGTVALDNEASKRIFEKFGFVEEGVLRRYYVVKDGKRINMILYSMLKEEWEAFKKNENELVKYVSNTLQ